MNGSPSQKTAIAPREMTPGSPMPPTSGPPRGPRVPGYVERVALGVAIALVLLMTLATMGEVYQDFRWFPRVDFTMYHAAARTVLAGEDLYHFHEPGGYLPGNLPYPYPPLLASLLTPLGKLSVGTAYCLWVGFLVICLGCLTWITARVVAASGGWRPGLLALGALLASLFLLDSNVYWGQVNIPVMALVAGGLWAGQRGRPATAGALIGLAAALKVLPAALLLWFLVRRDWRATGAFVGTALGAVLLVPALAGGPAWALRMNAGWLDLFLAALTQGSQGLQSGGGYVSHLKNGSLVATFDRIFGGAGHRPLLASLPQPVIDSLVNLLRLVVMAVTAASVVRLVKRRHPDVERWLFPLAVSVLLLGGWLVNILLWDHHLIGLVLILPVVAAAALDPRLPARWRMPLWLGLVAAVSALVSGWFPGSRRWGIQTLCFLLLWGAIAWALVSAPPPPARAQHQLSLDL